MTTPPRPEIEVAEQGAQQAPQQTSPARKNAGLRAAFVVAVGMIAAGIWWMSQEDEPPVTPAGPKPINLVTTEEANLYAREVTLLGAVKPGSCVTVETKPKPSDGFVIAAIKTPEGVEKGVLSARLLADDYKGTPENCRGEIRRLYADSAKPDEQFLPREQTYITLKRSPLFFEPKPPQSGVYAEALSCVQIVNKGHTRDMFHVRVFGRENAGDAYIERKNLHPLGKYDWDNGCHANLTGKVVNPRPKNAVEPTP